MGPNSCAKLQLAPKQNRFHFPRLRDQFLAGPQAVASTLCGRGVQINPRSRSTHLNFLSNNRALKTPDTHRSTVLLARLGLRH